MSHSPSVRLKKKTRIFLSINLTRLLLIITCMVVLFPIIWMATASISKGSSLFSSTIIPKNITLKNYINLFEKTKFIKWIRNSAIVTLCGSLLALLETTTMAYAFHGSVQRQKERIADLDLLHCCRHGDARGLYKLAGSSNRKTHSGIDLALCRNHYSFNAWLCAALSLPSVEIDRLGIPGWSKSLARFHNSLSAVFSDDRGRSFFICQIFPMIFSARISERE